MAKCASLNARAPCLGVMQPPEMKPLEESIADYCSAIKIIAPQKDCVKALSASAPCEDYCSAIILIALQKDCVKALSAARLVRPISAR